MKNKPASPVRIILLILVLVNIIIIRDGFLLSSKLYFALFGSIPLMLYVAYGVWKTRRNDQALLKQIKHN